jgi:hypothetical protein
MKSKCVIYAILIEVETVENKIQKEKRMRKIIITFLSYRIHRQRKKRVQGPCKIF